MLKYYQKKQVLNIFYVTVVIIFAGFFIMSFLPTSMDLTEISAVKNQPTEVKITETEVDIPDLVKPLAQQQTSEEPKVLGISLETEKENELNLKENSSLDNQIAESSSETSATLKLVDNELLAEATTKSVNEPTSTSSDELPAEIEQKEIVEIKEIKNETIVKTDQPTTAKVKTIPKINRLVIPKIKVDMKIIEGEDEKSALNKGAWRLPMTLTPNQGGNTVISAHRYLRRPPSPETFWDLDKMVIGDEFIIYWEGKEYKYVVRETKVVEPTELSILFNTPESIVTLFTCTPIFTSKQRLVVIGELISN